MFIYCGCFVLSGRSPCFGLITRSEESYKMCLCKREPSTMRRPRPDLDCCVTGEKLLKFYFIINRNSFLWLSKISVTLNLKTEYQFVRSKTCLANKLDSELVLFTGFNTSSRLPHLMILSSDLDPRHGQGDRKVKDYHLLS